MIVYSPSSKIQPWKINTFPINFILNCGILYMSMLISSQESISRRITTSCTNLSDYPKKEGINLILYQK